VTSIRLFFLRNDVNGRKKEEERGGNKKELIG